MLVLTDGRPLQLLPPRCTATLVPVECRIRQLLFPNAPPPSADEPPLGGGLEVFESSDALRITAGPIPPAMVSKLYNAAGAFLYGDPIFSVLVAIAIWKWVRHNPFEPFFWYALIGQFLAFTIGASSVRHWIRGIAARRYEVSVDRSKVKVVQTSGSKVVTHECNISDVGEVRNTAVVSEGEGTQTRSRNRATRICYHRRQTA
jgi:hypothetical protein